MKIRLRGRKREAAGAAKATERPAGVPALSEKASKRQFLKALVAGAGLVGAAGLGQMAAPARRAEATFDPDPGGRGFDRITTHLQVEGYVKSYWGANEPEVWLERDIGQNRYGWYWAIESNGTLGLSRAIGGAWQAVPLRIEPSALSGLVQLTGGSVGIGTTSPSGNLNVSATRVNIATPNNSNGLAGHLLISGVGDRAAGSGGMLGFAAASRSVSSGADALHAAILGVADNDWDMNSAGALTFHTTEYSGGAWKATEKARITSAGNIGIGTAAPVQKLDVVGNIWLSGYIKIGSVVAIDSAGVAGSSYYAS